MSLETLRADVAAHRARIARLAVRGQSPDQLAAVMRVELAENLYPLLEVLLEVVERDVVEPLTDVSAAVDELIDQSDEILHPATTSAILAAFAAGETVARILEAATAQATGPDSEVARRAVEEYRALTSTLVAHLASITLEPAEDEPLDDADNDDAADDAADDEQDEQEDDDA